MDVGGELFAVLAAESSEVLAELERVLEMFLLTKEAVAQALLSVLEARS